MKQPQIFLNGKLINLKGAKISIFDRGFAYGDGVFESLRTFNGRPFLLAEHLKRLLAGAKVLMIRNVPTLKQLKLAVLKTVQANNFSESYIKITITRGEAKGHGLSLKKAVGQPNVIVLVSQLREIPTKTYQTGWKAIISSVKRPDVPTSRLKTLAYVDCLLAKAEADRRGAEEALMLDEKGFVAEGTVSNVFIVKDGVIYTPPTTAPILNGITRTLVIKLAKESAFEIIEKELTPKELYAADEVFVTSSGVGIMPVTRLWKRRVGNGRCGAVTAKLIELYGNIT